MSVRLRKPLGPIGPQTDKPSGPPAIRAIVFSMENCMYALELQASCMGRNSQFKSGDRGDNSREAEAREEAPVLPEFQYRCLFSDPARNHCRGVAQGTRPAIFGRTALCFCHENTKKRGAVWFSSEKQNILFSHSPARLPACPAVPGADSIGSWVGEVPPLIVGRSS